MRRLLSPMITWSLMAVALFGLLVMSSGTAEADYFGPCAKLDVADKTPGASSDIASSFGVGIGPDCQARTPDDDPKMSNFGAVISFAPPQWGVAADADLPDGTKFGELDANATLGLLNNTCRDKVYPEFELMDGTTNSGNPIIPAPPGTPDRLKPLSQDANSNGVVDGAEFFPSFLGPISPSNPDALFSADVIGKLRARLFGATTISGVMVILNFMIFEPGTAINRLNDAPFDIDAALGYPSVTVLNDPTATASDEDPITDFCAPLATDIRLSGKVGANAFRTNPAADGAYNFMTFTASQYDADGDGIENSLDPCPFNRDDQYGPNGDIAWDPRGPKNQNPGDRDVDPDFGVPFADGITDICDPFPDVPSNGTSGIGIARTDEDGDGWANKVDTCPLIANVDQKKSDNDGIGDACDPNPTTNDGNFEVDCLIMTINIGAGGTAPYTRDNMICTKDAVGIDKNGNGVFDSREGGGPTPTPKPSPTPSPGDADGDGVPDASDNCLNTANPDQKDTNNDGQGDACDDSDGDKIMDAVDRCPDTGVGSLAPAVSSIPAWAAIASGLGGAGLLGSIAGMASRILRRRR